MGYHIETVHSRLPSLLNQDGWTSDLRDRSITLRVPFREDSDPSLRGARAAHLRCAMKAHAWSETWPTKQH